jgi:hypothetical protein
LNGVSDGVIDRDIFPAADGLNTICRYLIYQPRYIWCFLWILRAGRSRAEKAVGKYFLQRVIDGKTLSPREGKCGFITGAC